MSADSEEAEAINALNGKEFMGRQLNVSKARS
jgi:RNA recognition motif-containing protein